METEGFLTLNMNTKHHHSRLNFVKYTGVFQSFVAAVDVAKAIANLYFRRKNKTCKKEIETNA
jgi:hypothetical protein